jgi:methionyl aminopeptidase
MVFYKTDEEIELIRESCLLVCKTLAHVGSLLKPGITGAFIDAEAETFIRDHKGIPAFKGYRNFPASLCVSINEVVVHGIPSQREFKEGDIVSVDCGIFLNDYCGDAAYTFPLGEISDKTKSLLEATYRSLYLAIDAAVSGKRIGDVSFAVQDFIERRCGFGVVRELVGHGIGKNLHEEPEVPNFGKRGQGLLMRDGLVIAIEPMVNMGKKDVAQADDGWTIFTKDRLPSAHYEHTIAVKRRKADILSDHSYIVEAIKKNSAIQFYPQAVQSSES